MKRTVKKIHHSHQEDIGDLITFRALPTAHMEMIDPFLFLNHHGYQVYPPHNQGLPFGPHPHRGFETVTFILQGDIAHKDSAGHESVINSGGVQWMTAGSGLIHEEISSTQFKREGGPLEILQLWINLPASLKMTKPNYRGLAREDIPTIALIPDKGDLQLVSGAWNDQVGPFKPLTDVTAMIINLKSGSSLTIPVPETHNIFCYLIRGKLTFNEQHISSRHTIEFHNLGAEVELSSYEASSILFCHAPPLNEPVVSYGPFVMNTQEEILEAIRDYQSGKFTP